MSKVNWTPRYKFWQKLHGFFNRLAHKYADPGGDAWGKAYRTDHTKLLWRLNDWASSHYIHWWIEQRTGHKLPPTNSKESK